MGARLPRDHWVNPQADPRVPFYLRYSRCQTSYSGTARAEQRIGAAVKRPARPNRELRMTRAPDKTDVNARPGTHQEF